MLRYIEGTNLENFECELRRHGPVDGHVRWPVQGPGDYNFWFSSTIKDTQGQFALTTLLRQPSVEPSSGQGNHSWPTIVDGEVLTTTGECHTPTQYLLLFDSNLSLTGLCLVNTFSTAVMVVKTQSPLMRAGIGLSKKLRCEFVVDHKKADTTVEWVAQFHGERRQLFSHSSRTRHTVGKGVDLKSLEGGDASYTLPYTKATSKGSYICSVSVSPVSASVDISLLIEGEEPPRVLILIALLILP